MKSLGDRVMTLRDKLQLNQTELGEKLGISAMQVSRMERGIHPPSGHQLIALGKLAGAPDCWEFWKAAGLSKADVKKALSND